MNMKDLDFFKKVYKLHGIGFFNYNPLLKKKFYPTHTYKSKVEIWATCAQLDLKVMCKRRSKKRIPFNFHEFWSEEIHSKIIPKKSIDIWTLKSCEYHGMMGYNFWSWCPIRQLEDPMIASLSSHIYVFFKMISLGMS
jgi:hypothetical protein